MFAYLQDFASRHRRKFYIFGAFVGGITLLSKVAQHKLLAWQEQHAQQLLQQQRRKRHYDCTVDTCRVTVLQLLPNLRRVLEKELDSDTFLAAIKEQPDKKRQLWEELKLIGFGRAVCIVVCGALTTAVSHVVMMVFAANTLDHGASNDDGHLSPGSKVLSNEVQAKYLSCLEDLIEEQLPLLVARVMNIAVHSLSTLPLTRKLTLPQLESILQQIILSVINNSHENKGCINVEGISNQKNCNGNNGSNVSSNSDDIKNNSSKVKEGSSVLPWGQYLRQPRGSLSSPEDNKQLQSLYSVTVDILNTDDFNEVVNTLVQIGLNSILDEVAVHYYNVQFSSANSQKDVHEIPNKRKLEKIVKDGLESKDVPCSSDAASNPDETPATTPNASDSSFIETNKTTLDSTSMSVNTVAISEVSPLTAGTSTGNFSSHSSPETAVAVLVVKLVPLLNGLLYRALPAAPHAAGGYADKLLMCAPLEALAYTVYTAVQ